MINTVLNAEAQQALSILYEGAREVLGAERLQDLKAGAAPAGSHLPLTEARFFHQTLEAVYGPASGQGLAMRIGRAAFHYGLAQYGEQIGFRSVNFRLLPAPRRVESGLLILAKLFEPVFGSAAVTDEGGHWLCRFENGSHAPRELAQGSLCFFMTGLLQEFTLWAGGGRVYRVTAAQCLASGSTACQYRIDKKPLD